MFVIKDKQVNYILEKSNGGSPQPITKTHGANTIDIDVVFPDYFWYLRIYFCANGRVV